MKSDKQIRMANGLMVIQSGEDGGQGLIYGLDAKRQNRQAVVVWSNGGGWDHVSVSWSNRCPTWDEMCRVKNMFFEPEETVVEYHPAQSAYVNVHPYCLHLWRKQDGDFPVPPTWMVGPKQGESVEDAFRAAEEAERHA